jgi:hypothetical protein
VPVSVAVAAAAAVLFQRPLTVPLVEQDKRLAVAVVEAEPASPGRPAARGVPVALAS